MESSVFSFFSFGRRKTLDSCFRRNDRSSALYARNLMTMPTWSVSVFCVVAWVAGSGMSSGVCRVDEGKDPALMVRELKGACGDEDRQALAVSADDVLTALQQGRGVVLKGIVLAGDLPLDRLSLEPFEPGLVGHPAIVERIEAEQVSEVRVIHGPFMLEDVEVRGIFATNLIESGYIVVRGPVSLRGSTIERSMDLSRMVFLDRADFFRRAHRP